MDCFSIGPVSEEIGGDVGFKKINTFEDLEKLITISDNIKSEDLGITTNQDSVYLSNDPQAVFCDIVIKIFEDTIYGGNKNYIINRDNKGYIEFTFKQDLEKSCDLIEIVNVKLDYIIIEGRYLEYEFKNKLKTFFDDIKELFNYTCRIERAGSSGMRILVNDTLNAKRNFSGYIGISAKIYDEVAEIIKSKF